VSERWSLALVLVGCAARPSIEPAKPDRIAIAVAERGEHGARLVAIDEHGDRRLDLVLQPDTLARDTNPAISPDGRWIVFASSRGRTLDETNLWIAPLVPEATPQPLTHGPAIDSHPAWTHRGTIVFASTRTPAGDVGHQFDLYELAIDAHGRPAGAPRALTATPSHEITPCVAPDGTIIYASVTPGEHGAVESHLEARAPDGTIARLTAGPGDASPAVSPDGAWIAFARPFERKAGVDGELWLLPRTGDTARQLVDLPLTDESGPVWSRDGRFVFATSARRGARGTVVFSSVIVGDPRDPHAVARILQDRTGAIARLTPAVAADLDARALDNDPEYLPELARITAAAIAAQPPSP